MWQLVRSLMAAVGFFGLGAGLPAAAEDRSFTAVVELFTSQGCSACPPADQLLKSYVERPDVLALSFPVDYWDYLGWRDTFASPRFTERQRAYAKARGDGRVYTPQIVINGRAHAVGSRKKEIDSTILAMHRIAPLSLPVRLREIDGAMTIEIDGTESPSAPPSATVWVATVQQRGEVDVRRGENGGQSLTYYNIVRQMTPVGMWTGGRATLRLDLKSFTMPGWNACAVLVQDGPGGPIIGAAWREE